MDSGDAPKSPRYIRVETSETDNSIDMSRSPIKSPNQNHRDYNRFKYYSALRTGFKHIGRDQELLTPPVHVVDEDLFLLQIPFIK